MIFALGDVSGAHINPVVRLIFALRRVFSWRYVMPYIAAQLVGALFAAAAATAVLGAGDHGGRSIVHVTEGRGFAVEVLVTILLTLVITNTANRHSLLGADTAIAVGATVAACNLWAGELTTASMNPARSLGPAIIGWNLNELWVFTVGPVTGVLVSYALSLLLRPKPNSAEHQAAQGDRVS